MSYMYVYVCVCVSKLYTPYLDHGKLYETAPCVESLTKSVEAHPQVVGVEVAVLRDV